MGLKLQTKFFIYKPRFEMQHFHTFDFIYIFVYVNFRFIQVTDKYEI